LNWRWGLVIGLTLSLVSGCSPKRVSSNGVLTEPAPALQLVKRPAAVAPPTTAAPQSDPDLAGKPNTGGETRSPSGARPLGTRAVELARAQLGKPYQWGAAGPSRFDCSGLVQYVYSNLGVALPRVSRQQASAGIHVERRDLRPGDLVFFTLSGSRIDHVGIYVGQDRFIHAPRKHNPVREDSLHNSWWHRKFKGGRRIG